MGIVDLNRLLNNRIFNGIKSIPVMGIVDLNLFVSTDIEGVD